MLQRLFPASLTNTYSGSWVALWLLVPVLILKTIIGFNFLGINPFVEVAHVLKKVDGIPLDTFDPLAARMVVEFSMAWGVALFALCLAVWTIILRYRSAIPLGILLLLVEQIGRAGIDHITMISRMILESRMPAPSGFINLGMTTALLAAFILALAIVRKPLP
jgi:hypothetical protein